MGLVKICPSCGNENEVNFPLCQNCRNNLAGVARTERGTADQVEETTPPVEVRPWTENRICPDPGCRAENPTEEENCLYCNSPMTGALDGEANPVLSPSSAVSGCPILEWPWGPENITERLPIGRDPDFSPELHIHLDDYSNVSNYHAEIRHSNGAVFVTDLGSTNGTFLNGRRLSPHVAEALHSGDEVRFAKDLKVRYRC